MGFQLICCQCFDQFGTDVVTDAMPLGFPMLQTPEPSPFSLDAPRLQNIPSQKDLWQLETPTLIEHTHTNKHIFSIVISQQAIIESLSPSVYLVLFPLQKVASLSCLCQEVRFHCSVAPLKTANDCMGSKNGDCRAGNKCYIKDDGPQHIYATCCCSRTDTPIDMIEHNSSNWSCFASEVDSLSETHGKTPFCDIHCCRRQGED